MQRIITKENAAVVIVDNGNGHLIATFWVNARNGLAEATITSKRWSGKTLAGAEKWARRALEAHYA